MKRNSLITAFFILSIMLIISYAASKDQFEPIGDEDCYICTACGYVYIPWVRDEDNGIPPGTPFEELPDDWVCPICGCSHYDFKQVNLNNHNKVCKQSKLNTTDKQKENIFAKL